MTKELHELTTEELNAELDRRRRDRQLNDLRILEDKVQVALLDAWSFDRDHLLELVETSPLPGTVGSHLESALELVRAAVRQLEGE